MALVQVGEVGGGAASLKGGTQSQPVFVKKTEETLEKQVLEKFKLMALFYLHCILLYCIGQFSLKSGLLGSGLYYSLKCNNTVLYMLVFFACS